LKRQKSAAMTKSPRSLSEPVRFITDHNLGKLAKWLRFLGYDTLCHAGKTTKDLWNRAFAEHRVVLTRKKDLHYDKENIETILITNDDWEDQLGEVFSKLALTIQEEHLLKRCSVCNHGLKKVDKGELGDQVPSYILETHQEFYFCEICKKVYWRGTHVEQIEKILRQRNPTDRP